VSDGVYESLLSAYLDEHGDTRTLRAELAELRAQVRYALDDWGGDDHIRYTSQSTRTLVKRLRALVGPWPHEVKS
jgi:uncharacterized protein YukE